MAEINQLKISQNCAVRVVTGSWFDSPGLVIIKDLAGKRYGFQISS